MRQSHQADFDFFSKSIEPLAVFERVLSDNPDSALENAPTSLDPPNWRKLCLSAETVWEDGTRDDIRIETLCPLAWLAERDTHSPGDWAIRKRLGINS